MEDLIKTIKDLKPTQEQIKGKTPEYAFGWIDCLTAVTKAVKNYGDLHSVVGQSEQLFTDCVVCGKKYKNPNHDSDTCYDCREPHCK